jgi:hypothetical protein
MCLSTRYKGQILDLIVQENENLRKAEELLAKVGFKGSLFTVPPPPKGQPDAAESGEANGAS